MKLIFCMQINIKVSYKLISNIFGIKVSYKVMDMIIIDGQDQAFSKYSKQKVCNIFTISQKEARNGVHFLNEDKRQSFYMLVLLFLMEVVRHVQSTQNRKLVMFLQHIRKKCCKRCYSSAGQIFISASYLFSVNQIAVPAHERWC